MAVGNNWEKESGIALRVATESSNLLLQKTDGATAFQKETFRDLVTEYDYQVQNWILEQLASSSHPVISEEQAEGGRIPELTKGTYWVVDPIDGTVNFAYGIPFYAVSVGLVHNGETVVGAVSAPALKELYFTHGDHAAYLNGKKLKEVAAAPFERSLFIASFSSLASATHRDQEYHLFGQLNDHSRGCLRLGSAALGICYVAAGRANGAYGLNVKIWDIAGALAVARRAGYVTFINWHPNSFQVDYIVGTQDAVDQVKKQMVELNLIRASGG